MMCEVLALAFVFFMLAATWRNKVDYRATGELSVALAGSRTRKRGRTANERGTERRDGAECSTGGGRERETRARREITQRRRRRKTS